MRKYLTDFDPKTSPQRRAQRERLARAAIARPKRRKPRPFPVGWVPPV